MGAGIFQITRSAIQLGVLESDPRPRCARPSASALSVSTIHVRVQSVHSNARCLSSRAACERLLKTQEQKLNDAQHVLSAWGGNSHQLPNVVAAVAECATQFPVSAPQGPTIAHSGDRLPLVSLN